MESAERSMESAERRVQADRTVEDVTTRCDEAKPLLLSGIRLSELGRWNGAFRIWWFVAERGRSGQAVQSGRSRDRTRDIAFTSAPESINSDTTLACPSSDAS